MIVPFVGGAFKTFSKNLNAEECINFYPVPEKTGGKTTLALRGTPGLVEWIDLNDEEEVRNVIELGRWTYWVCGNRVYQVDTDGTAVTCAGTLDTTSGYIWMAINNADQIMLVDGTSGYTITDTTLTKITDTDFPNRPTSVAFQDGYFIVTYEESGRIYISALNDGTSWDGTDYGNAEARPDDSIALISDRDQLVVLGEKSTQTFQNTGATFPFQKLSGSTQSVGINAPASLIQFTNTFFWLTNELQFVQAEGYGGKPISPPAIDYQINQMGTTNDCVSFGYLHEGAAFIVNQFPTANQTWVYDVSTGFWHRRTSYPNNGRWRGNCYVYFAGKHLVGDHSNGKIYQLDFDTVTDNGKPIKRKRIAPVVNAEGKEVFHDRLEIFFESGVGLSIPSSYYNLAFDASKGKFTIGNTVTGATSGATALVYNVFNTGTAGILSLYNVSGTFQDNEVIYESAVGSELVTNGDMELDANWSNYSSPSVNERSAVQKHGGSYSRRFTADSANDGIASNVFTTETGSFYIKTSWIYPDDATTISLQTRNGDNSGYYSNSLTGLTQDSWNQNTIVYQETAGGAGAFVAFESGNETTGSWYIDDVSVKKITNAALANGTISAEITNDAIDPQAMLRWSNDSGHTWSNEHWRSIGKIGEHSRRAQWNRLGSGRNRNYELTVSAPVKWVILGANLEARKGNH